MERFTSRSRIHELFVFFGSFSSPSPGFLGSRTARAGGLRCSGAMTFAVVREFTSLVPNMLVYPDPQGSSCTFYSKDGEHGLAQWVSRAAAATFGCAMRKNAFSRARMGVPEQPPVNANPPPLSRTCRQSVHGAGRRVPTNRQL